MRVTSLMLMLATILTLTCPARAVDPSEDFPIVHSRITSVGLFKNGLAVVRRTATLPAAGTFEIENIPQPVHGTLWLESNALIETRVTTRLCEMPLGASSALELQDDLAGRVVTIRFRDGGIPAVIGRVLDTAAGRGIPSWLELQPAQFQGTVKAMPTREEVTMPIQEQLIVELYSR